MRFEVGIGFLVIYSTGILDLYTRLAFKTEVYNVAKKVRKSEARTAHRNILKMVELNHLSVMLGKRSSFPKAVTKEDEIFLVELRLDIIQDDLFNTTS